jgi:hypothetical protein
MDVKQTFITRALTEYNERTSRAMKVLAQKYKVGVTGNGVRSIAYTVAASGSGAVSNLSFKEYLRFVDMGVGRGHPLGGLAKTKVVLQAQKREGEAFVKDRTFKPRKMYSKPAYGNLTILHNQVLYGYTEEARNSIINELKQANGNNIS